MRIVTVTLTIALLTVLSGVAAFADDTQQQGNLDRQQAFSIQAQALDAALLDFSDQANVQVMVAAATIEGLETNGVEGNYTPRSALAVLLDSNDLQFTEVGSTVAVTSSAEQGGDSDSKNSPPTTVLMAKNQSSPQTTSSLSSEGGASIVTGKVTDARTGANLKGAKVTIEETGQWTSTDDLGEFRFVNVPTGSTTLTVSYLGYAGQSAVVGVHGDGASQNFALRGGSEIEEIVVFGQRSARALALNQERTAHNSTTVISSDLLGNFTGTTISEALRRAPGVAFEQDFDSGDGTNIILRGLSPDFNTVRFNGIELPEGTGLGRSASLNNVLADAVESVTISKTLLPSQDSTGTGGLVEIETKSPLDRVARFAQFGAEHSSRDGDFTDGYLISGQLSGRFGNDDNIGLGLSVQYRDRDLTTIGQNNSLVFGDYLPLDREGGFAYSGSRSVPPGNPFPYESSPGANNVYAGSLDVRSGRQQIEDLSIGLTGHWQISPQDELRIDYQRLDNQRSSERESFGFAAFPDVIARPVAALGGEERRAYTFSIRNRVSTSINYTLNDDQSNITDIFNVRGEHTRGAFTLNHRLSFASGEVETPDERFFNSRLSSRTLPGEFVSNSAVDATEGLVISLFPRMPAGQESIPFPLLTEAGFGYFSDPSTYNFTNGGQQFRAGENDKIDASISGRYDFRSGILQNLVLGLDYERSEVSNVRRFGSVSSPNRDTLDAFGIEFDDPILTEVGATPRIFLSGSRAVRDFFASTDEFESLGLLVVSDIEARPNLVGVAVETEFAPYIQGQVNWKDFELVGGLRVSRIEIDATNLNQPLYTSPNGDRDIEFQDEFQEFLTDSATQTEYLPRFSLNYRPQENTVVRFGYYRSVARPRISDLSARRLINLDLSPRWGPGRDLPRIVIREGNEELEPARTDSFDLSYEKYFDSVGVIKIAAFYKRIENLLEQNALEGSDQLEGVNLPPFELALDYPVGLDIFEAAENGELFVQRTQPVNSPDDAEIWGYEIAVERQLDFLPGRFGNLGIYANYVHSESSKDQTFNFFDVLTRENTPILAEDIPFDGSPEHSGSFAINYAEGSFDANLIYSFQDRRVSSFDFNGLSRYFEDVDTLDARASYFMDTGKGRYEIYLEGTDLLRGSGDASLFTSQGDAGFINSRSFLGGREIRIGLSVTF